MTAEILQFVASGLMDQHLGLPRHVVRVKRLMTGGQQQIFTKNISRVSVDNIQYLICRKFPAKSILYYKDQKHVIDDQSVIPCFEELKTEKPIAAYRLGHIEASLQRLKTVLPSDIVWAIQQFSKEPEIWAICSLSNDLPLKFIDREYHVPARRGNPDMKYEFGGITISTFGPTYGKTRHFYARRRDLETRNKLHFTYLIGGQFFCSVDSTWLLTHNTFHDDEYIVLPFPCVYYHRWCNIRIQSSQPVPIFSQTSDTVDVTDVNRTFWFQQITKDGLYYPNTHLDITANHLLYRLWIVLCFKDKPVKVRPGYRIQTDPLRKLELVLDEQRNNGTAEDGTFYREIMPLAFNEHIPQNYIIYQMIFQKPPADPTINAITGWQNQSCLNCSRIDSIVLACEWNVDVLREQFGEANLDQVSLSVYAEVLNEGIEDNEFVASRFSN